MALQGLLLKIYPQILNTNMWNPPSAVMLSGTKCSRNIPGNGHIVNIGCVLQQADYFSQGTFPGDPSTIAQDDILEDTVAGWNLSSKALLMQYWLPTPHFGRKKAFRVKGFWQVNIGFKMFCKKIFTTVLLRLNPPQICCNYY